MYPSPIEGYVAPTTVDEAVTAFARWGEETHYIAGGQSLMQAIKSRMVRPRCLVDLQKIDVIQGIHQEPGTIRIGAMTRYCDIASSELLDGPFAALIDGAAHVGDRQVRHRGTIGGSLCWNYISACMPAVNLAIGSRLILASSSGETRALDIEDFLGAPLETSRREGELLLSVELPQIFGRAGSAYRKWSLMTDGLPVIGVSALLQLDDMGSCSSARISVTGLESGPIRILTAERALIGVSHSNTKGIEEALNDSSTSLDTHSDEDADAEYRRVLFRHLGRDVVNRAFVRALGNRE